MDFVELVTVWYEKASSIEKTKQEQSLVNLKRIIGSVGK